MIKAFPIIFILLWSSAFITTQPIVDNSDPFSALAFRFFLVSVGFLIYCLLTNSKFLISKKNFFESFISGILFHGIYLGGVFYSISVGLPTSIAALIVTLQPILTNILAGPVLKENVTYKQWIGITFGFIGAVLVLGFDIGKDIPLTGVIATILSLISITVATLWQKKLSNNLPLQVSNIYQALGGCIFHLIIIIFFGNFHINFSTTFIIAMSHQILLVSFGAFTILMFLIRENSASKTVSLLFLVPPTSALMAWYFLNENLYTIDLIGFGLTSFGVFIATRKN